MHQLAKSVICMAQVEDAPQSCVNPSPPKRTTCKPISWSDKPCSCFNIMLFLHWIVAVSCCWCSTAPRARTMQNPSGLRWWLVRIPPPLAGAGAFLDSPMGSRPWGILGHRQLSPGTSALLHPQQPCPLVQSRARAIRVSRRSKPARAARAACNWAWASQAPVFVQPSSKLNAI